MGPPSRPTVSPLLVVDAANVVGSRPDGWWRDRPGAAERLLHALVSWQEGNDAGPAVVLVLEGRARAGAEAGTAGSLRVVHAAGSGDDEIVDVVAAAGRAEPDRSIVVVTADRGLRDRVQQHGAETQGPHWLWDRLEGRYAE